MKVAARIIYLSVIALILIPLNSFGLPQISKHLWLLLLGLVFAFVFTNPYPSFNKKCSKYLFAGIGGCPWIRDEYK